MISKEIEVKAETLVSKYNKDNKTVLEMLNGMDIETQEEYESLSDVLLEVKKQIKKLDTERISIVKPINDAVSKINALFQPTIKEGKTIEVAIKKILGKFVLKQKEEQTRALNEAAKAGDVTMLQKAEDLQVSKVQGISNKIVYDFIVKNVDELPEEFIIKTPNTKAIGEVVARMGDQTNIRGVEVIKNVSIRARTT